VSDGGRFVLGVDLDGVCGDYIGTFRRIVAERLGVSSESLTRDVSWGCKEWGIRTPEEFDELHRHAVLERHMLRHMDLIPGAAEALWRLSDAGVWIRIVTHRLYVNWGHAVTAGDTAEWLDTARIPYRDLCFIAAKSSVSMISTISVGSAGLTKLQAIRFRLRMYSSRKLNTSAAFSGRRDCNPRRFSADSAAKRF